MRAHGRQQGGDRPGLSSPLPLSCGAWCSHRNWQSSSGLNTAEADPTQAGSTARTGHEPQYGDWLTFFRGLDVLKAHSKANNGKVWKSKLTRAFAFYQGQPPAKDGVRAQCVAGMAEWRAPDAGAGDLPFGKKTHSLPCLPHKDKPQRE